MLLLLLLLLSRFSRVQLLCEPIDSSPPDSPVSGILQARTLEWVAISFSSAWKWKVKVKSLSCVQLLATPWTAAYQAPPSVGFSRQEYWSGVPLPSLIDTHTHIQKWLPSAQLVKNLPATKDTRIQFLDQEDPLEKEMAIQSSILAWRIRQRSLTVYSP